mgnify:CR=1 FL=1
METHVSACSTLAAKAIAFLDKITDLPPPASFPPHAVWGTLCGLFSAVGYTAANACLRAVSDCDPIWVSAMKAIPTLVMVGPWIAVQACRGRKILPEPHVLWLLAIGALIGQLIGNVVFQWSLGVIGLALAVPLTLVAGRLVLAAAILWVVLAVVRQAMPRSRRLWATFAVMGLLNGAVGNGTGTGRAPAALQARMRLRRRAVLGF